MTSVIRLSGKFLRDESGQDLIEYALIAALIALAAITAMSGLANGIQGVFNNVAGSI